MRAQKVWRVLLAVALFLAVALPAAAGDNPFHQASPFKTAIINYAYSGSQSGTATTYFKGDVRAEHKDLTMKILGISKQEKQIVITEPQRITTVDLVKGKATYTGNYLTYLSKEYAKLSPAEKKTVKKNSKEMGNNFMALMGGKPQIRQGTFMGRPVDIVSAMGLTTYSWRGKHVVLKQEGGILGMQMNMTATNIAVGAPVPAGKLKPPAGITPVFDQKQDQQQREMAKRVMTMLKDPDFGKKQAQASQDLKRQMEQEQAQQQQQPPAARPDQGEPSDAVQKGLNTIKKIFNF